MKLIQNSQITGIYYRINYLQILQNADKMHPKVLKRLKPTSRAKNVIKNSRPNFIRFCLSIQANLRREFVNYQYKK